MKLIVVALFITLLSLSICNVVNLNFDIRSHHSSFMPDPQECYIGGQPGVNADMESCCWYTDNTCCTAPNSTQMLSSINKYLNDNVKDLSSNDVSDECKSAIASLSCMLCNPDSGEFISDLNDGSNTTVVLMCATYCDKLYSACQNSPDVANNPNITDGSSLCKSFNDNEYNVDFEPVPNNAGATCMNIPGENFSVVTNSTCIDWDSRSSSSSSSHGLGAGEIVLIVLAVLICLLIIGLLVAVIGFFGYTRYKRNKEEYPTLIPEQ